VHDLYVKNPSAVEVRGISLEYDAYVEEVIRRNEPGTYWSEDSHVAGEKSYPYPIAWCSRRIINGDDDLLWIKYTIIRERIVEKNRTPNVSADKAH
jgi:hypothetical protein